MKDQANIVELADALLNLSQAADRAAQLLLKHGFNQIQTRVEETTTPLSTKQLSVCGHPDWPVVSHLVAPSTTARIAASSLELDGLRVLEYAIANPVSIYNPNAKIDLVCRSLRFHQPPNTRIVNLDEADAHYDVGLAWESLEFDDPAVILAKLKSKCAKIFIRFRPWTSRDGAFLGRDFNFAYAHLAQNVESEVSHRVVRPIATYEALLQKVGLVVESRRVNTQDVDDFFLNHDEILATICERTWGAIDRDLALKILATTSVDYVVS